MSESMHESDVSVADSTIVDRRGFLVDTGAAFAAAALAVSGCSKKNELKSSFNDAFSASTDYEGLKNDCKALEQQVNEARSNLRVLAVRKTTKSDLDDDDLKRQPQIDAAREKVAAHNARVTALINQQTDNGERKRIHKELWIDIDAPKK
jgi:outer membrane protein TolC